MLEKFKKMFLVTKDVSSIRKKGVWVEEIETFVETLGTVEHVDSATHVLGPGLHFYESINKIGEYGIYSYSGSAGLPTIVIGCKTQAEWIELRGKLREANLVR